MRVKPFLIAALVCGAAVLAPNAWAQSSAPAPTAAQAARLDLLRAWRLAVDRDPQLKASRAATAASAERVPQARAQLLPNVGASFSRNLNVLNTTQPNLLGELSTTHVNYTSSNDALTARQPLYRKPLTANLRQAEYLVEDARAQLERDTQQLVTRVAQAYFETLLAQEQIGVLRQQQAAYSAQLDGARKSLAAGTGTRTDIDAAQAKFDLSVAQELELRQALELSRRQLQILTDERADNLAAVDVPSLVLAPPQPETVDGWLARAEATSPELRSLRAQLDAAREEVNKAQGAHHPTLDGVAQVSRSTSDNVTRLNTTFSQRFVGLQLTVPIYQGGAVDSQVREALARYDRAEQALEATRRDLLIRLQREFRGVSEGVLRIRALEQAVRSAEQFVLSSQRSFEAGVRTRIDILNAEQQLAEARRDLAQARYVYLNARVRLRALTGEPIEPSLAEVNAMLK